MLDRILDQKNKRHIYIKDITYICPLWNNVNVYRLPSSIMFIIISWIQ